MKVDPRIGTVPEEVEQSYGKNVGAVMKRVFDYERRILVWSVIFFITMIGILALNVVREDRLNLWVSLAIGLVTNLIFLSLTLAATSVRRKSKSLS
jgi:hypothetical protein